MRDQEDPGPLAMTLFLLTLMWVGYAFDAYIHIHLIGAVLAPVAGLAYVIAARLSAPKRELPWLFGWNDETFAHLCVRMPLYAALFLGPLTYRAAHATGFSFWAGDRAYSAVGIVALIVGFLLASPRDVRVKRDEAAL